MHKGTRGIAFEGQSWLNYCYEKGNTYRGTDIIGQSQYDFVLEVGDDAMGFRSSHRRNRGDLSHLPGGGAE